MEIALKLSLKLPLLVLKNLTSLEGVKMVHTFSVLPIQSVQQIY